MGRKGRAEDADLQEPQSRVSEEEIEPEDTEFEEAEAEKENEL
jgi:hypothetical protein